MSAKEVTAEVLGGSSPPAPPADWTAALDRACADLRSHLYEARREVELLRQSLEAERRARNEDVAALGASLGELRRKLERLEKEWADGAADH